jgi:hypothetical protein
VLQLHSDLRLLIFEEQLVVAVQRLVELVAIMDLLIKLGLFGYLIKHFELLMIVRVKDLFIKAFFRIVVTEGLQKNSKEVVKSLADQKLDKELLAMQ